MAVQLERTEVAREDLKASRGWRSGWCWAAAEAKRRRCRKAAERRWNGGIGVAGERGSESKGRPIWNV